MNSGHILLLLVTISGWWFTKILWGSKVGKYSLFLIIPYTLFSIFISIKPVDNEGIMIAFGMTLFFAFCFVVINVVCFLAILIIQQFLPRSEIDYSDPEVQRMIEEFKGGASSRSSFKRQNEQKWSSNETMPNNKKVTGDYETYGLQENVSGSHWSTIAQGPENWMIDKMEQKRASNSRNRYRVVRLVNGKNVGTSYS